MLVETQELTKIYNHNIVACDKICLSLAEGQVFGLLGPNGAGKSTLVKMLLGLVWPSSGQALIKGHPLSNARFRQTIGYLPEMFRIYEWLTAEEYLRFCAGIYAIPVSRQQKAMDEALELVNLKGREKEKIRGYSKGMQQRLALAGAIIHHPDLLFLDEPTSALDPIGRRDVRDLVGTLQKRGTTIFLNSHLLSELEMTCTHFGFINKGKLVASGEADEFLKNSHEIMVEAENVNSEMLTRWQRQHKLVEAKENKFVLQVENRSEVPSIISAMAEQGARIFQVESRSRRLEDVFMDLIEN